MAVDWNSSRSNNGSNMHAAGWNMKNVNYNFNEDGTTNNNSLNFI